MLRWQTRGDLTVDMPSATALATATIAALVAIITYGQWRTNCARLQHELFDRRYDLYQKIAAFLAEVLQSGSVAAGSESDFLRQTKQAYFAFGGDTATQDLVLDIYKQAAKLQALQATENSLSGAALNANVDRQSEVKQWFQDTLNAIEPKFAKYLRPLLSKLRLRTDEPPNVW